MQMSFWNRRQTSNESSSRADEELCREVVKGNHDAFLALFDRYWRDVFRLAYSVLRNSAEAEDLVQGLFLEVHTTMLRYDEKRGSFRTLLLRYAYTRAIDHRRHLESRRYYTNVQIEELEPELLVGNESLASGLSLEVGSRLIEQGLERLDDKQRAVVTAYFFRGLSLNEIAHELGESFGNVRHHLYRGLERMRRVLAPKDETNESTEPDRNVIVRLHRRLTKQVGQEVSVVRARSI
jgi:RNA polymerase sigma-70 factor (ECF subfamily)